MIRLLLVTAATSALTASAALAQPAGPHAGHNAPAPAGGAPDPHAGHNMPAPAADPHAGHATPAPAAADPHAGHAAPAQPADPHAGHVMPGPTAVDPHAGHNMPAQSSPADLGAGSLGSGSDLPVGSAAAPATINDNLADRVFDRATMERARAILRAEHGGSRASKAMVDLFEVGTSEAGTSYAWNAEFRYGGDVNRLVAKTEGEGAADHEVEAAEIQALWSRAVGPYFDIQAGLRQDVAPRARTYATVGFEGLAPYWFDVEGALFLSSRGDVSARLEGAYDLRLTQRLILQPRAELELSASDVPERGVGSGLSTAEVGLRLRYELGLRELGPYVGVTYERSFGGTADFARAAGEDEDDLRLVVGLRAWF